MSTLGILRLDTQFPRPRGDIGHADTFAYPVDIEIVSGATPDKVVHQRARGLVDQFCDAAQRLEARGCRAIISSCGFLALHQERLANAVSIPLAASSLLLVPFLPVVFGQRGTVGILTASAASLSPDHLAAAGIAADTPINGIPSDTEFARVIIGNLAQGDLTKIGEEVVEAACVLVARSPSIVAIVLECTNMGPYRTEITRRTGKPVFDLLDLANLLMSSPPFRK